MFFLSKYAWKWILENENEEKKRRKQLTNRENKCENKCPKKLCEQTKMGEKSEKMKQREYEHKPLTFARLSTESRSLEMCTIVSGPDPILI